MMNCRFDHSAIHVQLATTCQLVVDSQIRDALIESLQRLRLNEIGSTAQRALVRHSLEVNPA
jgi:hypothetical protein